MPAQGFHDLSKLQRFKQLNRPALAPLGEEMVDFFKQTVQQRQTKLAKIAQSWVQLVPETLNDHCALHGLSRGTLTVLVDSAAYLYELKQLLLAGLENQLLLACASTGLRRIALKPGRPND
jgi:hypothetical protein